MEYDYRYLVDSQTWDVGFGLECDGADCPVVRIDIVNTMTSATPNVTWRCRSTWKKIEQDWSEQVSRKELFWTILPIVWVFLPFDPWIGILLDESNCLLLIWGLVAATICPSFERYANQHGHLRDISSVDHIICSSSYIVYITCEIKK